nr:zinc finger, CCHC-type [Tanacetum cinerariifolium]
MLMTMEPEIQRNLKPLHAHEMLKELKTLFAQQAEQELLQTTRDFHSCRQEEWQLVSSYVLKMKGYIDNLDRLGYPMTLGLGVIQNAVQNPRVLNIGNQIGLIGVQGNGNQNQIRNGNLVAARAEGNAAGQNGNQIRCYNCRGVGHYARNCIVRPRRRDAAYLQTQLLIAQKEEA